MFQHSSEDEGEKKKKYTENHETSCKLHKRQGERENELQLIQERLQNEEQQKGNKKERKGGKKPLALKSKK